MYGRPMMGYHGGGGFHFLGLVGGIGLVVWIVVGVLAAIWLWQHITWRR